MLLALGQASNALAACSIKTSAPAIGPVDSFTLYSAPQGVMAGAGFYCTPELVALNSTNTLSATLASANQSNRVPRLLNGAGRILLAGVSGWRRNKLVQDIAA